MAYPPTPWICSFNSRGFLIQNGGMPGVNSTPGSADSSRESAAQHPSLRRQSVNVRVPQETAPRGSHRQTVTISAKPFVVYMARLDAVGPIRTAGVYFTSPDVPSDPDVRGGPGHIHELRVSVRVDNFWLAKPAPRHATEGRRSNTPKFIAASTIRRHGEFPGPPTAIKLTLSSQTSPLWSPK
jgi:hypothetical protein